MEIGSHVTLRPPVMSETRFPPLFLAALALAAGALGGCATASHSDPHRTISRLVDPRVPERKLPTAGHAVMMVESRPEGGVVVVDGRPVGSAPCVIEMPVTDFGYLRREVSVKVRFVTTDPSSRSSTTEVRLTPLDRAPVRMDFTPLGARRFLADRDG
jgi:hypothetical protein